MSLQHWFDRRWFGLIHDHNLIYNTCWEDPRIDRAALALTPDDTVLVITSAGCNALDYALAGPRHVYAVDVNPRQNALLELKLAAIRALDYDTFYEMFGRGRLRGSRTTYQALLRPQLSSAAREFWDRRINFFAPGLSGQTSFYFHGTTGLVARLLNLYINRVARVRDQIESLLAAPTVAEQQRIYENGLHDLFWGRTLRWFLGRDTSLSLLGVPAPQRLQLERHYAGGVAAFVEECVRAVFTALPLVDNYFWRVYLCGEYTRTCCPQYLIKEDFERLRDGLADRITTHTCSVEQFLTGHDVRISRFVLLDHMDWLSAGDTAALQAEWQAMVDGAAPGARVIWRSAGLHVDYVDPLNVRLGRETCRVGDLLTYHRERAAALHRQDRVHTYGSFYIADLAVA
ncbi:MAG: S-adenosylmethionine--diacylglycerol 3-amino-3-carboxypropyl transferase [Lentisphaerae bacterium RIFOXYB12_FULL_65_16]|nr:MAG: S-adenosylmethionine--diacylglycerol 3-amino-3-carboxypropyl transferase [Lentisphaerae bacterium RIFOXYA12_64_32]OGV93355.1 MAG: S-adenosylmethionine--diacylglycerol 3-amino-3-carboxypropyl transferase [Lentisphaerae bacterium RIFOXYB12_FULL_65_16]